MPMTLKKLGVACAKPEATGLFSTTTLPAWFAVAHVSAKTWGCAL